MPEISERQLAAFHQVAHAAAALAAAVQFDDTGAMVAGHLQGGNGGLLSRETIHKAGLVQLSLNDLNKLPDAGKEG